ncbi:FbpB family small basic protein [Radiobacillus sp. PE A8.2]
MSLRKKPSFEELVNKNKTEILTDDSLLDEIDEKIENRWHEAMKANKFD